MLPLRGKAPLFRGGRGVLDATSDPETVDRWWTDHPAANIGGRVPDGAVVVDVDPRYGGDKTMAELVRSHGPLPATLTVVSGRGDGGRHYYYRRTPGELTSTRLGAGIDLKTSSGYCVLPPSIHPDSGRPYVLQDGPRRPARMPEWLAELLAVTRPSAPVLLPLGPAGPGVGALAGWVSRLEQGRRNHGLFWAACRALERAVGEGDLEQLVAAGIAAGLSEVEARRTVASARRRAGVAA